MSTDITRENARQKNGEFGTQPLADVSAKVDLPTGPEITIDWVKEHDIYQGSSFSGWGTRATITPPDVGDGETFYWETKQNGWTWDGYEDNLEAAQASAQSEANRMLVQQKEQGIDFSADDEEDDDEFDDWGNADDSW